FQMPSTTGPIMWRLDPDGSAHASSPKGSIHADALVIATGDPSEFDNYRVGFIQTIVDAEEVVDYVGGQRFSLKLPVPIRDGPPRDAEPREAASPPWFSPPFVKSPQPGSGVVSAAQSDSPGQAMPYHFKDPNFFKRQRGQLTAADLSSESGNVLNRAHRRAVFHTWLVARHKDAPLED